MVLSFSYLRVSHHSYSSLHQNLRSFDSSLVWWSLCPLQMLGLSVLNHSLPSPPQHHGSLTLLGNGSYSTDWCLQKYFIFSITQNQCQWKDLFTIFGQFSLSFPFSLATISNIAIFKYSNSCMNHNDSYAAADLTIEKILFYLV